MKLRLPRRWWTRTMLAIAIGVPAALFVAFPGRRFGLAFTIATGFGRKSLQARIDAVEERATEGRELDDSDRRFLSDFYRTLATGGRLSVALGQTGRMMDHYLDGTGEDFRLDPVIFKENETVRSRMTELRVRATSQGAVSGTTFSSPEFHMADDGNPDSVFGLYWGTLHVTPARGPDDARVLRWRAEVPWKWPTYDDLRRRYGTPDAERFPVPGIGGLLFGGGEALLVGNGLGGHLAREGLARPFLAFAEWDEPVR